MVPDELVERRTILTEFSLNSMDDYATWAIVIQYLATMDLLTPAVLSEISVTEVTTLSTNSPLLRANSLALASRSH